MCAFGGGSKGSSQPIKNIIPQAPQMAEKAPEPIEIKKDGESKVTRKRNPLRIELARQAAGSANTGVAV